PHPPEGRYSRNRPRVGNFSEHTWGTFLSLVSDGHTDLDQTREFIDAKGWPSAKTVVRHYKIHARASAEGLVVTEYPLNRVALQAREDIKDLCLELQMAEV
ncbi:hypothetical protein ACWDVC_23230, partial [Gordonia sputi]